MPRCSPHATITELTNLLDRAARHLDAGCADGFGHAMLTPLDQLRRELDPPTWRDEAIPRARAHRAYAMSQACPFSARSTARPRGYAGDARTIDFLYGHADIADEVDAATERGRQMCDYWSRSPAAAAVRYRRDFFRDRLVELSDARDGAVLSIACGHMRDVPTLAPSRRVVVYGLDQDAASVAVCEARASTWDLRPRCDSVRTLLRGEVDLPPMSLVYAAGLFDYLSDRAAVALIRSACDLLEPGGSLFVTNFLPSCVNRASMELLQDWFLIYRDQAAIERLVREAVGPGEAVGPYFEDPFACVGYLQVVRR